MIGLKARDAKTQLKKGITAATSGAPSDGIDFEDAAAKADPAATAGARPALSAHASASEILAAAEASAGQPPTPAERAKARNDAMTCDVVIVGCGVAGCFAALHLPRSLSVVMLSKGALQDCDSMLAQGGICVLHDPDDYDSFFDDTMRAGHFENRAESVDIMIRSSRNVIDELRRRGVRFATDSAGNLAYTREGAHSRARICHHQDITGREITTVLQRDASALPNVRIMEDTAMVDLLETPAGTCAGVLCRGGEDRLFEIRARDTVLACGGIGGLYARSTNFPLLTGDGCRVAHEHGVRLEHVDYVQVHPTGLYTRDPGRSFLISESARGEGAVLLDAHGRRFTDELQPRDVVSDAIFRQMAADGTDHVMLSFCHIPAERVRERFPNIWRHCLEEGYDITAQPVPVVPTQHYFMGGIHVDRYSATTMPHLYAAGETSCNGVHGKNRLASNSLLESLVFAERAARAIASEQTGREYDPDWNLEERKGSVRGAGPKRRNEAKAARMHHAQAARASQSPSAKGA